MDLDTDSEIANFIFKLKLPWNNISPNFITFLGLISTLLFGYFLLFSNKNNKIFILIGITLFFRFIADIMDGFIARKFNKTSLIGNQLDTISDFLFNLIFYFFILVKVLNLNPTFSILLIIGYFGFTVLYFKLYNNHDELKLSSKKNFYRQFVEFTSNNSFLISILFYFIIYLFYFDKK